MTPFLRTALGALLAGATLALAACGGSGGGDGSGAAAWRALNLSTDVAAADVLVDDARSFTGLAPEALTDYSAIGADTYTLKVRRSGSGSDLYNASHTLTKDRYYTALIWGRENALRLSTLPEDATDSDITSGNLRLRVFNATIDSGSVDVYVTASETDIADSTATQGSVGAGTLTGYREITAGTFRLRVTGAGDPADVRLDIAAVTLPAGRHATLVLTAGGGGVLMHGALLVQQGALTLLKNTQARVRLVASVGGGGTASATIGGRTLTGALRSPSVGPYTRVDVGGGDLVVRINGSAVAGATCPGGTAIAAGSCPLAAGGDYTLLAWGDAGTPRLAVIADDNRLPTVSGRARLRLVNGTTVADPLTLSVDFAALAIDVGAGQASSFVTVTSSGSADIDVTSASFGTLFTDDDVTLSAGAVYTVFMLGGNAAAAGVVRKER